MYDDSVHSGLTTVSQFVPSIFLSELTGTDNVINAVDSSLVHKE